MTGPQWRRATVATVVARFGLVCLLLASFASVDLAVGTPTPETVVREFVGALGAGQVREAVRRLSPSSGALLETVTEDLRITCFEVASLNVLRSEIAGDRATVDVAALMTRVPRGKGRRPQDLERIHFVLAREGGEWRIVEMPSAEELLVAEMMKSPGDAEKLVAAHPELIGPRLVYQMVRTATTVGSRDYRKVQRQVVDLALHIATAIDDRAGVAFAVAGQLQDEDVPGADRAALIVRAARAFELAKEAGVPEVVYVSGYVLGVNYMMVDDSSARVEPLYDLVLTYRDSLRSAEVAALLTNLGQTHYFRQDYARAYVLFRDALALTKRPGTIAQIELALGWLMEEQNDLDQAMEHFRRAVDTDGPKPFVIQALIGIARIHREHGRLTEAWEYAQKALETSRGTPFKGLTSASYILLTEMQIARGETTDAEATLQKALAFAREAKAEHIEMSALLQLGKLHFRTRRYDDALRMAREAEAVWRTFNSPGAERYEVLMLAGRAELALGHRENALNAFTEAISAVESVRGAVASGRRQQAAFFEPYYAAYGEVVELLLDRGAVEEALIYAERGKGRVLLDTLGQERTNADSMLSDDDRQTRSALIRKLGDANRRVIVLRAAANGKQATLDEALSAQRLAEVALDRFDSDIDARDPHLRAARGETAIIRTADLDDVVTAADFAIVEYVIHDRSTSMFVVERRGGRTKVTHHRIDVTRADLDRLVRAYGEDLSKRGVGFRAGSRALHELLLEPAAAELARKRVLCIIPDGSLWHVPFGSLSNRKGQFLVESVATFSVPSISVYREMLSRQRRRPGRATDRPLVAFGNPAIAGTRETVTSMYRAADLGALPDAEAEVKSIGRLWGPRSAVYIGSAAREDVAKREMAAARIIHFAAHGIFDDANPMFSEIVLAPGRGMAEDGVLQAWELMRLDLSADLVVLSACETARGRIGGGEGVIGMSWALFAGGCPSTVVTQWKVASTSAGSLMVAFHRALSRPASEATFAKARALRAAQLAALHDPATAHPFHWAGFVLVGSGS
jgi:CHAT domain-containing protein/Tfp pilus assembly protein PilF